MEKALSNHGSCHKRRELEDATHSSDEEIKIESLRETIPHSFNDEHDFGEGER